MIKEREAENPLANASASPTNSDESVWVELHLRFSQINKQAGFVVYLVLNQHSSAFTGAEDEDAADDKHNRYGDEPAASQHKRVVFRNAH